MNKFDLFCLIFLSLDAQWDKNQDEILGDYLSSANPFLFEGIGSADPDCFDTFCKIIKENHIEAADSYNIAKKYIEQLNIPKITEAFMQTDKDKWNVSVNKYLSSPHKC